MKQSENPIANPAVVLREEFDDWAVLFNPDTGDAVGINPVGVEIWKLMDGKHSIETITKDIKDCFKDVPDAATEEITKFIDNLNEQGFVGYELEVNSR